MIAGFQHLAMCRFVRKKKKKSCRTVFQSGCTIFAFSPEIESFWFWILASLWYFQFFFFLFFNFSHLIGCKVLSHCCFNFQFLNYKCFIYSNRQDSKTKLQLNIRRRIREFSKGFVLMYIPTINVKRIQILKY